MKRRKLLKKTITILLLVALGYGFHYIWFAFPIISGYSAKNACSCVFIQGRGKDDILKRELGSFPLSLGSFDVRLEDSSIIGSVLGLARRKAIFRKGLGCTLVNEIPEATIRAQSFVVPKPVLLPDTSKWLLKDSDSSLEQANIHAAKLESAINLAFNNKYQDKAVQTSAILIVHRGKIIAEKYAEDYTAHTPLLGWSMAKSITGALIGILVKDGKLSVNNLAPIAHWAKDDDKRKNITIEHLLQQTSGLNFEEDYATYSHATNMLFYKGDMADYVAQQPAKIQPGQQFYYSSGNSNLLSHIIRQTVGKKDYPAFPYDRLFHKIGMNRTLLEPDASGTFVGSSYIFATARDYARFGLLYLNNGVWNGERILPEGWVQKTATSPPANDLKNYGYQFWLNGQDEKNSIEKTYPGMPADMFMANGYGGQRIYIIPSRSLVIVRLGLNRFDEHQFLKEVLEAVN